MSHALKVLVYGATGSQAGPVVQELLRRGHEAFAATRDVNSPKCEPLRAAGATLVAADLDDPASLRAASEGMDAVSLMIPAFIPNPMNYPVYAQRAVEAAREAGVGLLVWNTSGPVIDRPTGNPMYDLRLHILDMLRDSGVPAVVLQPTAYMENLLGPWTRPAVVERDELTYPVDDATRIGWIASEDLGKLTVAALERPELAGRRFIVSGVEAVTGPELAAAFSAGLGRTITYRELTLDEFALAMDAMFGPGVGAGAAAGYQFQKDNAGLLTMWVDMEPVLAELPVQMTTLAEWSARRRAAFSRP